MGSFFGYMVGMSVGSIVHDPLVLAIVLLMMGLCFCPATTKYGQSAKIYATAIAIPISAVFLLVLIADSRTDSFAQILRLRVPPTSTYLVEPLLLGICAVICVFCYTKSTEAVGVSFLKVVAFYMIGFVITFFVAIVAVQSRLFLAYLFVYTGFWIWLLAALAHAVHCYRIYRKKIGAKEK